MKSLTDKHLKTLNTFINELGANDNTSWYHYGVHMDKFGIMYTGQWIIKDVNRTREVELWIKDNNFPPHAVWLNQHKMLFKLTFG